MIFLNRLRMPALAGMLVLMTLAACEEDPTTIGAGIIGSAPFITSKAEYDVFAFNKKIEAVQTNRLPVYQVGVYNDPFYGRTEARITSQLRLSVINPNFGRFSKEEELDPSKPLQQLGRENENETVTEVFLYIPYLTKAQGQRDSDNDGVDDIFDSDPNDPNNDNDGDGVSNTIENSNGTDPLDPDSFELSVTSPSNTFAKRVDLDSIYGDRNQTFGLKVERSTFFLRDLDPNTNFEQAQEYFSSGTPSLSSFVSDVLFDGDVQISDEEKLLFFKEDDPDTDVIDTLLVETRLPPGIRIPLDPLFFQRNLIDKEGDLELLSQGNFTEFLRGIHLSITPEANKELFLLLDLASANINVSYKYTGIDNNGTPDDASDDKIGEDVESSYVLNLIQVQGGLAAGNAVNTFINDAFPPEVIDQLDTSENASRIYLKGGAGSYAELRLFDEDGDAMAEAINDIKANNWIINEANLVFYVDRTTLDNAGMAPSGDDEPSREPERLYLYDTETGLPLINFGTEITAEETLFGSFLNYDGIVNRDSEGKAVKYTIKITDHINNLVVRDADNVNLGLTMTSDINRIGAANAMVFAEDGEIVEKQLPFISTISPAGTVLFGSKVEEQDLPKKLRLEIFYTEAN